MVALSAFAAYAFLVGVFESRGDFGPYLSPFFSPTIDIRLGGFLVPPGIWIAPFPLAFRLTCYYYRKAIFRGYLWHPRSCAVAEPHRGQYRGETRFWIFNNLHRFALYLILGTFMLVAENLQQAVLRWQGTSRVNVYFDAEATPEQIRIVEQYLNTHGDLRKHRFISREQALAVSLYDEA